MAATAEPSIDFNELLTPELRAAFAQQMEVVRADSSIAISALDQAQAVLRVLVTAGGKSKEVDSLPHASIHIGRSTVLPVLMSALLSDDPDPDAWIEAIAKGSFNLSGYAHHGELGSDKGAPGTYLPRLLNKMMGLAGDLRSERHPARLADVRTALAILLSSVLIREMRKGIAAKAALGPAWPLMVSMNDHTTRETRRKLDALGADTGFHKHLAGMVETAINDWVDSEYGGAVPGLRTNDQIERSPPDGVNVELYFRERRRGEEALLDQYDAMVLAELESPDSRDPAGLDMSLTASRARKLANEIRDRRCPALDFDQALRDATAYLNDARASAEGYSTRDSWSRIFMPAADAKCEEIRSGLAMRVKRLVEQRSRSDLPKKPTVNEFYARLFDAIMTFARDQGPPPENTPLDHYWMFEAAACDLETNRKAWPARQAWQKLGLFVPSDAAAG